MDYMVLINGEKREMRVKCFRINGETLINAIGGKVRLVLPKDAIFIHATLKDAYLPVQFGVFVWSQEFDIVPEGTEIPVDSALIEVIED